MDGSYVTAKDEPGDIDVMLVLKTETNLADDLSPTEYNAQSKRMVRRLYGFDLFAAVDGSAQYNDTVDFLSDVKTTEPNPYTNRTRKGIVRIEL